MKKNLPIYLAMIALTVLSLACGLPALNSGDQPAAPGQVATIVASTLEALTPPASNEAEATPQVEPPGLLPQSLYYLANDPTGLSQVFRLETDGRTVQQVTFEPAAINTYDVSPANGSVAYVANNQLLLIDRDGSNRRVLVDGGPVNVDEIFTKGTTSPIFSPDGQTIAYTKAGALILYSIAGNIGNVVLENTTVDPSGATVPAMVYIAQNYSPDGRKILLTAAIPNSDGISSGIYDIAPDTFTGISGGDGARVCCSEQAWSPDSSSLYMGLASLGMFSPGLWRADASTGNITTLLPSDAGGGNFNFANQPYLAPDGQLYYFYVSAPAPDGFADHAPLQMVRSTPDAVTGRTVLRPETFETLNEALWAPDASFVVAAKATNDVTFQGGVLELFYTDSSKTMVPLVPFGWQLKWGP